MSRIYKCTRFRLSLPLSGGGLKRRRCEGQATSRFTVRWTSGKLSVIRSCEEHAKVMTEEFKRDSADSIVWWSEASI